ncbi:hypothetical protein ACYF6T_43990 [Streptomyces sp. 7R007]
MQLLGTLDVNRFREEEREATARGLRAPDELMHDDWYVAISDYGDPHEPSDESTHDASAHGHPVETLNDYGARIRAPAVTGRAASDGEKLELDALRKPATNGAR